VIDEDPQAHSLCALGDADWVSFEAHTGNHYRIFARPTHATSAVDIKLYNPDGSSLLAAASPGDFGQWTTLEWDAPVDGVYGLQLTHLNPAVAGDAVTYEIYILNGYAKYMPQVGN
jgi:hypothetical protein